MYVYVRMYMCNYKFSSTYVAGFEKLGPHNFIDMNGAMRGIDHKIMRLGQ